MLGLAAPSDPAGSVPFEAAEAAVFDLVVVYHNSIAFVCCTYWVPAAMWRCTRSVGTPGLPAEVMAGAGAGVVAGPVLVLALRMD